MGPCDAKAHGLTLCLLVVEMVSEGGDMIGSILSRMEVLVLFAFRPQVYHT